MPTKFGDFFKANKDLNKFDTKKSFTLKAKASGSVSHQFLFINSSRTLFYLAVFRQKKIKECWSLYRTIVSFFCNDLPDPAAPYAGRIFYYIYTLVLF